MLKRAFTAAQELIERFYDFGGGVPGVQGRVYGPRVYTSKNVGKSRPWTARSRYMPHQGGQEIARRKRQIEARKLIIVD